MHQRQRGFEIDTSFLLIKNSRMNFLDIWPGIFVVILRETFFKFSTSETSFLFA